MGKNTIARVPHNIAEKLQLPDIDAYTFHSFRRGSCTSAADNGVTAEQMVDFYGWRNASMCKEYISTSKAAVTTMAHKLVGNVEDFALDEVEIEVDVMEELEDDTDDAAIVEAASQAEEQAEDAWLVEAATQAELTEQAKPAGQYRAELADQAEPYVFAQEEDLDMYLSAGLPLPPVAVEPSLQTIDIENTIKNAISTLPNMAGASVNLKVVVVTGNNATLNF